MKVQFFCDSGANIHSCKKSGWMDIEDLTGLTDDEWKELPEEEKYKMAQEWAENYLEIYFEEQE